MAYTKKEAQLITLHAISAHKEAGYTEASLADKIGAEPSTLSRAKKGERALSSSQLDILVSLYGRPFSMLGGELVVAEPCVDFETFEEIFWVTELFRNIPSGCVNHQIADFYSEKTGPRIVDDFYYAGISDLSLILGNRKEDDFLDFIQSPEFKSWCASYKFEPTSPQNLAAESAFNTLVEEFDNSYIRTAGPQAGKFKLLGDLMIDGTSVKIENSRVLIQYTMPESIEQIIRGTAFFASELPFHSDFKPHHMSAYITIYHTPSQNYYGLIQLGPYSQSVVHFYDEFESPDLTEPRTIERTILVKFDTPKLVVQLERLIRCITPNYFDNDFDDARFGKLKKKVVELGVSIPGVRELM